MRFTKMQGIGNDFIILEAQELSKTDLSYSELTKKMCNRNFGIGADGLIIVNPPDVDSKCDVSWRIFNSDGSEPQMCGNGIRCFAKYVYKKGIVNKKTFSVCTLAGMIVPEVLDNQKIRVNMGSPILEASKIPVSIESLDKVINYPLETDDIKVNITAVSMGNPHCIIFTEQDSAELAKKIGPELEKNEIFPEKTNVEFVKVICKDKIKVDVWERGCGITLACGTGACASVVAGVLNNFTEDSVEVELPGGNLEIEWQRQTDKIFMTGGCEFVSEGQYFF